MRDALVTVIETLRDTLGGLGTGKIFVGPAQVEQIGTAPYWVIDVVSVEAEHAGPGSTEYRAEIAIYRVAKAPAGKAGDEAKLSILDLLVDVRGWASSLVALGYQIEPGAVDLQYDRGSDERQVVSAMTLSVVWQEC